MCRTSVGCVCVFRTSLSAGHVVYWSLCVAAPSAPEFATKATIASE